MRRTIRFVTVLATALAIGVSVVHAADPGGQAGSTAGSGWATGDRINVNTATVEQLANVPGLNFATAQAIVTYRDKNGPFSSLDQLKFVQGIDPTTVDALAQYLLAN